MALGVDSYAKNANEVNIGIWTGSKQTGTRTISGLADGKNSDDAVNKGQLDSEIGKQDTKAQSYASKAQAAAENTAKGYTDTEIGKEDTKAQSYATAAKGKAIKEANIYTDNSARQTLGSANSYTDRRSTQAENNAVARSNAYTDNRFGELRKNLEHTEKRLNAGIAGVTALASIPYVEGNKFSYGVGAGTYQNGNAVAAGVQFRVSPSTNVRLNISWDSAGNNATGVGIAGGW